MRRLKPESIGLGMRRLKPESIGLGMRRLKPESVMRPTIAILSAAAVVLGGCGNEAVTPKRPPSASAAVATTATVAKPTKPTKAEYIVQADAICAAGDREIEALTTEKTASDFTVTMKKMAAIMRGQLVKLRALTPPDGEDAQVAAMWDAIDEGLTKVENASKSELMNMNDPLAQGASMLRNYGMKHCGAAD